MDLSGEGLVGVRRREEWGGGREEGEDRLRGGRKGRRVDGSLLNVTIKMKESMHACIHTYVS